MAREMKHSGVEWIGEIPSSWNMSRLLWCLEEINEKNNPIKTTNVLSLTNKLGVVPYEEKGNQGNKAKEDYSQYGLAFENTLVINSMNVLIGSVGISKYYGCVSPVYYVYKNTDKADLRFINYIFQNVGFQKELRKYANGILEIRLRISSHDMLRRTIPLPSRYEQECIANYLDEKCGNIDAVIEQTRSSIEEYKKLKQVVITQAVTKGIRSDRKMKNSGVEWIGKMPIDWDLMPFRHVLHERNEKNSPVKSTERLSLSIDLGVTLYAEKTTNLDRFKDDFEQYKLAHTGDLVMNSMNMIVGASGVSSYYGCVSPAYYTFYDNTKDHITAKFCEYIFRSKTMLRVLYSLGKGIYAIIRGDDRVNTCRLKVSREDLRSIQIPLPTENEQREIVTYLDEKCKEIDVLIAKKEAFIQELENYKKVLIYEYVTGKKEVPA